MRALERYFQQWARIYALGLVGLILSSNLLASTADAWLFHRSKKAKVTTPVSAKIEESLKAVLPKISSDQPYVNVAKSMGFAPDKSNLTSVDLAAIDRYIGDSAKALEGVKKLSPDSIKSSNLAFKVDGVPVRLASFAAPAVLGSSKPNESVLPEASSYLGFGENAEQAIVSFISRQNQRLSYQQVQELTYGISEMSRNFSIDPQLLSSLVAVESSFNPIAISSSGAIGLGQLKPSTAQWLGVSDPFNPRQNLYGTAKYLRFLLGKYNGNVDLALAAYYKGQGTIDRKGVDSDARYYIGKVNQKLAQFN